MKLSNRAIYGIRALFDLAYHGGQGPVPIREIAAREEIPLSFLEQILPDLKRADLVASKRGPKGGYVLTRPAREVTLADVLEALDDLPEYQAPNPPSVPGDGSWGVTDAVCSGLMEQFRAALAETTLSDMMERGEELGVSRECYERFTYVI